MKSRWTTKALTEVCEIKPPKAEARRKLSETALVSFVPMEDLGIDQKFLKPSQTKPLAEVVGSYTYFADGDVLLAKITPCFENGKLGIATNLTNGIGFGSSEYIVFRPNDTLNREWLYYFLSREVFRNEGAQRMSGAVGHKRVAKEFIDEYPIPLPPLPEQQRIVNILDDAFDGIATAKANAEKNLQNARALFESHLQAVFTRRDEGWIEKTLGEVCLLRSGTTLPKEIEKPSGEIPYLKVADMNINENLNGITCSSRYVNKGDVNASNLLPVGTTIFPKRGGAILTNKKRLTTRVICADLNIMGVTPKRGLLPEFLFNYFLRLDLRKINNGSSIPQINNYSIEPLLIAFPESVKEQQAIVYKLASLLGETRRLESVYRRKLAALDELKKSLLHQAFTGELTKQSRRVVVIPFPTKIPGITTTDLHAGILATAFQLHQKNGKQKYFGHVKAEKIAHMVEAHLGIELGRTPVKDAAGPNDFRHLRGVEHRAKMAKFFDFQRVEGMGYRVTKHRQFEELIERTRDHLGERSRDLDSLLELMLPMNTEQAEVFVTVYAAWNNLLLDKQPITDESIVFEARENWHPNKLNLERRKFFKAIEWMKEHDLIPQGRGKKVNSKVEKKKS